MISLIYCINKKSLILLLVLLCGICFSQVVNFRDKETNIPLSYIEIEYNNKFFLTDSLGYFSFVDKLKENTFRVTEFNKVYKIPVSDSVILIKQAIKKIEEVVLKKQKSVTYTDILGKGHFIFSEGSENYLYIENDEAEIGAVELYVKKVINKDYYLQIDFYKNTVPYTRINETNILVPLNKFRNNKKAKIDLKAYKIKIPSRGLLMRLKFVNNIGSLTRNFKNEIIELYLSGKDKQNINAYNYTTRTKVNMKTIFINITLWK